MATTQLRSGRSATNFLTSVNATRYASPFHWNDLRNDTQEELAKVIVPIECSLRNFYLRLSTAPGAGKSWVFTIRVQTRAAFEASTPPSDTLMVITIADTDTEGSYNTTDIAISAGSLVSMRVDTPEGQPAATTVREFSIETVGVNPGEQWYGFASGSRQLFTNGAPSRNGVFAPMPGFWGPSALNESYFRECIAVSGSFTEIWCDLTQSSPGSGKDYTVDLLYNGATAGASLTIADTDISGVASVSLPVSTGTPFQDLNFVSMQSVATGSPTATAARASVVFVATTDGMSQWTAPNSAGVFGFGPRFRSPITSDGSNYATEAEGEIEILGPTSIVVSRMVSRQDFGSLNNIYSLLKNGASALAVGGIRHSPPLGNDEGNFTDGFVLIEQGDTVVHRWDLGSFYTIGYASTSFAVTVTSAPSTGPTGVIGPLAWIHESRRSPDGSIATNTYTRAKGTMKCPGSWENGFKAARVLQFGVAERRLSDRISGDWTGATMRCVISDHDSLYRGYFADEDNRFHTPPASYRMTTRAERALLGSPYTVFNGSLIDVQFTRNPQAVELTHGDIISRSLLDDRNQIPWRLIRDGFLDQLDVVSDRLDLDTPEPIGYGDHVRLPDDPDSEQGIVFPPIYLGVEAGEHVFLHMGHACAAILDIFVDDGNGPVSVLSDVGSVWRVPGLNSEPKYEDRRSSTYGNDRRYSLIRGQVGQADADACAAGEKTLYVAFQGIEPNGDGSGEAYTERIQQYRHFVKNFIANHGRDSYQAGAWLPNPVWNVFGGSVQIVDEQSFIDANDIAAERYPIELPRPYGGTYPAGYTGAAIIGARGGDRSSARRWVADWNRSCALQSGWTARGQYRVVSLHPTQAIKDAAPLYTDSVDIVKDSFQVLFAVNEHANRIPFKTDYSHFTHNWVTTGVASADESVANYEREITGDEQTYPFAPGRTMAYHLAVLEVRLRKDPPKHLTMEVPIGPDGAGDSIAYRELGDYIRYRAYPAIASSRRQIRLAMIDGIAIDVERCVARVSLLDCEDQIDYDAVEEPGDSVSPLNDTCASAIELDGTLETPNSLDLDTSLNETDDSVDVGSPVILPTGGPAFAAAWFKITPDADAQLFVTTYGSNYDTQIAVLRGTCGSSPIDWDVIGNNDNDDLLTSSVLQVDVSVGQEYYILVAGVGSPSGGRLLLGVQVVPA